MKISRRNFLELTLSSIIFKKNFFTLLNVQKTSRVIYSRDEGRDDLIEAQYYRKLDKKNIACELCFRGCFIPEGKRGFCKNRENRSGKLYSLVYNRPCALQVDPVEKEPMFHLLPGTNIFCTGTASCNFRCKHCHNYHMSHRTIEETDNYFITPKEIVRLAEKYECKTVSFTYNEPTVFFEFMHDVVKIAKENGFKAIYHSNGSTSPEPLQDILKLVDGVTIDLKAFTEKFYDEISSAYLEPVLETLKIIKKSGVWLEIVNLIIPSYNDNFNDIKKMCEWIRTNLGVDTPLHFTRFFPSNKLRSLPPTPIETLEKAHKIAKETGLNYVYIGNYPGHKYNSTICPSCENVLINRFHFEVLRNDIQEGRCKYCKKIIPGIWS